MRASFAATVLLGSFAFALPALAQGDKAEAAPEKPAAPADEDVSDADKEKANRLFEEGRQLLAEGKLEAACTKFDQSNKVRPGIGTMYNLADCSEKLGRTGTAYKLFSEVAERTKVALQAEREQKARERMAGLEPKLMKIRLSVPQGGKVKQVKIDGAVLATSDYNKALPYDPGEHVIFASTANDAGEPFEEEIELSEEGKTVTVAIPVASGAKMKRRVGMIVGGGITMGIGGLALAGFAGAIATDAPVEAIGALGALSVVGLAVGIPIFAVGFKKKPVRSGDLTIPLQPSAVPDVAIGPTGGSLSWRF